jgi:hypothetical protein
MLSCKYLHVPIFTSDYKTADSVTVLLDISSFCGLSHIILILKNYDTSHTFIYFQSHKAAVCSMILLRLSHLQLATIQFLYEEWGNYSIT